MRNNLKETQKTRVKVAKTDPIPVRLEMDDAQFVRQASYDTGLPMSDVLRRSVKLMRQQKAMFKGYSFILELA